MNDQQTSGPDLPDQGAVDRPEITLVEPLDLIAVKLTDVGRARPHNEDHVDYYVPPDPQQLASKGAIYLVADGMGGHQAGEVASRGAVEWVISHYYNDTNHEVDSSLVRAFHMANQQINAQAQNDPAKGGMGTTLVAAVILGRRVYVANVGDSRAYLIDSRGITQITHDHSWVEEQVQAGLLTIEQARRHPQRNLVTRALGSRPSVDVDLFEGEIGAGDTLLLCSDGLTGKVEDQEIAAAVREHPPQEAARRLVSLANERGGNDNISVLIVSAQQEPATIKAPAFVPAKKERRPSSGMIPALVVAAALLALLLVLLALRFLFAETATPTMAPSVPAPSTTMLPGLDASATVETTPFPTEVLSPSLTGAPPVPTATLIPTPTGTAEPRSSNTPARPSRAGEGRWYAGQFRYECSVGSRPVARLCMSPGPIHPPPGWYVWPGSSVVGSSQASAPGAARGQRSSAGSVQHSEPAS